MSIKTKFLIYFLTIFVIFGIVGVFSIRRSVNLNKLINQKITESVEVIQKSSKKNIISQLVRYDDEVLTASARNYAFTGDSKWKERYLEFVPKLDLRISEAILYGDEIDKDIFDQINNANIELIKLEEEAMNLVDKKNLKSAQKILESEEYWKQKSIYKAGLDKYLLRQGIEADSADSLSTEFLNESKDSLSSLSLLGTYTIYALIFLFFITIVFLFLIIYKTFMVPLILFKKIAKKITEGDLEAKVVVANKDEIGDFAIDFNKMTEELRNSIFNIEKIVDERTKELEKSKIVLEKTLNESERINKVMIGRELEMIKLKKEIIDLKNK